MLFRINLFLPIIIIGIWLFTYIIGCVIIGEIPIYGKHSDPTSIGIGWLVEIGTFFLLVLPISFIYVVTVFLENSQKIKPKIIYIINVLCLYFFIQFKPISDWLLD